MSTLPVTVFFDFTCPASYVAVTALQRLAAGGSLEVRARALERFPAPVPLAAPPEGEAWEEALRLAEGAGLALRAPAFRPRTRKAHEAAAFAAERGRADAMRSAIFSAYWTEGLDIGRIDVLASLAGELEMDPEDLRIELDIDRHRDAVLADEALAERLRIGRTLTIFVGTGPGALVLIGARSPEELEREITNYGSRVPNRPARNS